MDIFTKRGGFTQSIGILQKNTENISEFFANRGGGLADSKISLSEKTGPSKLLRGGGGGLGISEFFRKKTVFFFDASPYRGLLIVQRRKACIKAKLSKLVSVTHIFGKF